MSLTPQDQQRLQKYYEEVSTNVDNLIGYPCAKDFEYEELDRFLRLPLNNVGDPFASSTAKIDSREFEREVLEFWAKQLRAPTDNWWGYVTSGGTEGNLYALYLARELLPDGIVYYSRDTHYSVGKNVHVLNMRNIMIRSQPNGEIDYEDLAATMAIHRDVPPILFLNIGTTMTEARDDIARIRGLLDDLALPRYYIHADAAMSGAIAPFVDPRPQFDFEDGADSVTISGHKFIGSPVPCGMVLAKRDNVNRIARSIAYIGSLDTTIGGSRSGYAPLVLWYAMKRWGVEGMRQRATHCLNLAAYACDKLCEQGVKAWRNPDAITVVMPEVPVSIREKWQLASADGISHLIITPSIQKSEVDRFASELDQALQEANS